MLKLHPHLRSIRGEFDPATLVDARKGGCPDLELLFGLPQSPGFQSDL